MKKGRILLGAGALALALMSSAPGGAQEPQRAAPLDTYQVGMAVPPVDAGKTLVPMTVDDAIERALELNLDLQSIRLSPRIQSYSLMAAQAFFAPTFNATFGHNNQSRQSTSQLDGGQRTTTERQTLNFSLSQQVPWYGGRLSVDFNNGRTETNNSFTTLNPSFSSTFSLNYTQPLLAGFRTDQQRTALRTQEILTRITDLQVQTRVANTINQVRAAYWALRAAIEQIEIQRSNLARAEQLLAQNRVSVELGRMAEIQVVEAEASVAAAEQTLLNAEIQWRNFELSFKRLLVGGPGDELFLQTINPTSQLPGVVSDPPDIQAAIEFALRERTDIRQERQNREVSSLNLEVTRESARPDLNLSAGYSLQGVGGDLYERAQLGGDPQLIESGGYSDGLSSILNRETPTWNVTLSASYPIGMRQGKANLERARLQLEQTELSLQAQELTIVTQVTNAGLAVSNTFLQLEAARRSREASARSVEAVNARFQANVATNLEVVTAQNQLTTAQLSELRALIDHINAVAEFERVQRYGN